MMTGLRMTSASKSDAVHSPVLPLKELGITDTRGQDSFQGLLF